MPGLSYLSQYRCPVSPVHQRGHASAGGRYDPWLSSPTIRTLEISTTDLYGLSPDSYFHSVLSHALVFVGLGVHKQSRGIKPSQRWRATQTILVGPVASLVSIMQIGTTWGYYGQTLQIPFRIRILLPDVSRFSFIAAHPDQSLLCVRTAARKKTRSPSNNHRCVRPLCFRPVASLPFLTMGLSQGLRFSLRRFFSHSGQRSRRLSHRVGHAGLAVCILVISRLHGNADPSTPAGRRSLCTW